MSMVISGEAGDDPESAAMKDVKAVVSEHFLNYLIVSMNEDGDIMYEYTNHTIGKALAREITEIIRKEASGAFEWDDTEVDED
jgi:hypothetical protein